MFKNFGSTAQKFTFQIDVQKVILPDMLEHFEGTEQLAVCFERKNYPPIFTRDASITLNDQDEIVAEWHESLTTHATMFKDSKTGLYREKMGKLNLLQRRDGAKGISGSLDAFKSLGMATVPLHVYANPNKTVTNVKLHLTWCASEHAYLIVDISAALGDNSTPIDTRSETGSVDDNRSDNGVSSSGSKPSMSSLRSGGTSHTLGSSTTAIGGSGGMGLKKAVSTIKEEENEDEDDQDPFSRHVHSGKKGSTSATTGKPPLGGGGGLTGSSSSRPMSSTSSVSSTDTLKQIGSATSPVAFIGDNPEDRRFQSSPLYQKMKQRIDELEVALLTSQEVVEFEKNRSREALEIASKLEDNLSSTANNNQLLSKLQTDYESLRDENKLLKETNANISSALAKYTGEGSKLQSMITKNSDEITWLRDEKVKLEKLLRDKNDECENLLAELIKTKVSLGEMAEEFEETKKELRTMKAAREKALEARRAREAAAGGRPVIAAPSAATTSAAKSQQQSQAAPVKKPSAPNVPQSAPPATRADREREREMRERERDLQQQQQQQQSRGSFTGASNMNNMNGGGGGGYASYNNGYNNNNDDSMSVGSGSGYGNYNNGMMGNAGNNFNGNNSNAMMPNNMNMQGSNNFNNGNFSTHSNGSGGSSGFGGGGGPGNNGYGNGPNGPQSYGNNGMNNGYNNNNNAGFGGFNNNNIQTPMNNNGNFNNGNNGGMGGGNFFTPNNNGTPGGRANPFAQVGQQMGQMGNNVGNTLLRGFSSVSNVFNDQNSNNGSNTTGAQRRNPPPRPSFN